MIEILFLERVPFYAQLAGDCVGLLECHLNLVLRAAHAATETRQSFFSHLNLDNKSVCIVSCIPEFEYVATTEADDAILRTFKHGAR
jgi:hypothetical protein